METADKIRQYGMLVLVIVSSRKDDGYEMIAGHRRYQASDLVERAAKCLQI